MLDVLTGILAIAGALLIVLAGVGVLRFSDLYARMHAATKAPTLAIALISIAAAISLEGGRSKILLATAIIFVTAPSAAHLVARSAYRAEGIKIRIDGTDDLAALDDHARNPDSPGDSS
ncbi:MAG TPA: monovalent cation/H(+) antiporter subunit G [Microthrixaceae bacterium]|nr:monovalent cation/H(+) antiporter subunit G [Microthrixaceae bacterium]